MTMLLLLLTLIVGDERGALLGTGDHLRTLTSHSRKDNADKIVNQ